MSQELEPTTQAQPATTDTIGQTLMQKGVEKLRQHAQLKAMAVEYAEFITQTGACPEIYRGKPGDAAAAIIRGTSLGFDPDGALEAFFVIKGKTGMYARAMIAVAENIGCCVWEEAVTTDADGNVSVTWAGTRPGFDKVESVTWDMHRAKQAGYATNSRYKTNAIEMLRAKCQAELARILAPGALMGLYSEQEPTAFPDTQHKVHATAKRVQTPAQDRGLDEVRAALERKKETPTVDASVLGGMLQQITDATTCDEVTALSDEAKKMFDGDVPKEIASAANARWNELRGQQ